MKVLLNIIGSLAVILAILGIFLPLLPTTPFLLLASACYMRGSERMHRWLRTNKLFGAYLDNIESKKGMPLKGKIFTLAVLWLSMSYSIYIVKMWPLRLMLVAIAIAVTTMLLRMKTLGPATKDGEKEPQRLP